MEIRCEQCQVRHVGTCRKCHIGWCTQCQQAEEKCEVWDILTKSTSNPGGIHEEHSPPALEHAPTGHELRGSRDQRPETRHRRLQGSCLRRIAGIPGANSGVAIRGDRRHLFAYSNSIPPYLRTTKSTSSRQKTVSATTANLSEAPPRSPAPVSTEDRSGVRGLSDGQDEQSLTVLPPETGEQPSL